MLIPKATAANLLFSKPMILFGGGGSQYGTGVHAAEVRRGFDQFATNELNLTTTNLSYATEREGQLGRLDNMLANSAKKIPEDMNQWYDAVKALADSPNDMGSRKVVT